MIASPGRIVLYTLSSQDADEINRRRTTGHSIAERIKQALWPIGAQAHIGNSVHAGQEFPAVVIRQWGGNCCNLQVLLDGNDTFWGLSRNETRAEGGAPMELHWRWPPRVG